MYKQTIANTNIDKKSITFFKVLLSSLINRNSLIFVIILPILEKAVSPTAIHRKRKTKVKATETTTTEDEEYAY